MRKDEMGLDQQARFAQFPTPAARDYRSESGGGSDNEPLQSPIGAEPSGYDRALFPPGPADRDAWREIIRSRPDLAPAVEYEVRGMAARITGGMDFARPDQHRSLGNMVIPVQGAFALLVLLNRDT